MEHGGRSRALYFILASVLSAARRPEHLRSPHANKRLYARPSAEPSGGPISSSSQAHPESFVADVTSASSLYLRYQEARYPFFSPHFGYRLKRWSLLYSVCNVVLAVAAILFTISVYDVLVFAIIVTCAVLMPPTACRLAVASTGGCIYLCKSSHRLEHAPTSPLLLLEMISYASPGR